jgi:PAS domain S-box-containing protein
VDADGAIVDCKGGRAPVPDVLKGPCVGRRLDSVVTDAAGSRLLSAVEEAVRTGVPGRVTYTMAIEGADRHFEARLMPMASSVGARPHVLIVTRDLTERLNAERALRESEGRYRALIEGSIEGICINQGNAIRFVNQSFCEKFGCGSPDDVVGRSFMEFVAPHERERLGGYRDARLRGEPTPTRYTFEGIRADGTPLLMEMIATLFQWDGRPAILSTLRNVTAEQRAREAAAALAEVGRELAGTLNVDELLDRILVRVIRLLRARRGNVFSLDPATGALPCLASQGEAQAELMVGKVLGRGEGVVGHALARGGPVASPDMLNDPALALPEWVQAACRAHGFTAVLAVPLTARGRVIGALAVADAPGRVFTAEDIALAVAFADHAAVALANAWRFRELEDRVRALNGCPQETN